jgi:hypothetical protein
MTKIVLFIYSPLKSFHPPSISTSSSGGISTSSGDSVFSSPSISTSINSSGGSYPKQGLFLYNNHTDLSKYDEAYSKVGKEDGFGRGFDSYFSVRAQPWLQL